MSIQMGCICGNRFEADESQIGQTVKCSKCGSLHRVYGPSLPQDMARRVGPPPLLAYATPQQPPRPSGEVLADAGWRIAAVAALGAQGMRWLEMLLARNSHWFAMDAGPVTFAFACFGSVVALVVAVGLWSCETWARRVMLVIALLQTVVYVYVGQAPQPPGGPLIWYIGGAVTLTYWILLLERPTNSTKLTIGAILAVVTQVGMNAVTLWKRH